MDEKRVKELFSDEAFVKSLFALETPEEVQAAVKAKGVDLTLDEIHAIKEGLAKSGGEELSEADLEKVAGGSVVGLVIAGISLVVSAASYTHDATRGRW
ncbi:MAG: Nif11-like leader peptide family RiPP precursor [Synergistaceae bacterium]|jgi:predicted ribosomally synthesized peptide with nif11-like leader|nr:Nif11-like leader peptide family RiPP precursor [Synergistaceae bacterium]